MGMGATWDPDLAQTEGSVTGAALRASGWLEDFAPVQDISRDNRWGRSYETWGEQPLLAGAMGAAEVRGLQSAGTAATLKHFLANSQSINGHDRVQGLVSVRYLQDMFLPAYRDAVDAGARMVMVSSSSVNGVPATGSRFLQTHLLREEAGFDGVIISDYQDVQAIASTYHAAPDLAGAISAAVNSGLDMAMWVSAPDQWQSNTIADVRSGKISESRVDESVRRILALKFQLGLFDQPCVTDVLKPCIDVEAASSTIQSGREATLQAARESITLLQNTNDILPLPRDARVLITGPNADDMASQLGGWSVSWQGLPSASQIPPGATVRAAAQAADANATFVPTSFNVTDAERAAAVSAAVDSDIVVVVVGEQAYAEGAGDNSAPALNTGQQQLVAQLEATGRPVIIVVIAGRPIALGPINEQQARGIVMAYQGGTETGQAVADVLFGDVNPSGKLPVTWPTDLGDQPRVFDELPTTGSGRGSSYDPLYTFGFGLSYTTFAPSSLSVGVANGTVTANVVVTNTGSRPGEDVVPVFVRQPTAEVVVPPHRLVAFARVSLPAGESQTLTLQFPTSRLAVTPGDIDSTAMPVVENGAYTLEIPTQPDPGNLFPKASPPLQADFTLS